MAVANDHYPKPTAMRLAVVMVHATLATLIDFVIFTWFSLRLNKRRSRQWRRMRACHDAGSSRPVIELVMKRTAQLGSHGCQEPNRLRQLEHS